MRLLFLCLVLGLGSLQLSASNSVVPLPEVESEQITVLVDFMTATSGDIEFRKCCTAEDEDAGVSVRVCLENGTAQQACSAAATGLDKVLEFLE